MSRNQQVNDECTPRRSGPMFMIQTSRRHIRHELALTAQAGEAKYKSPHLARLHLLSRHFRLEPSTRRIAVNANKAGKQRQAAIEPLRQVAYYAASRLPIVIQ